MEARETISNIYQLKKKLAPYHGACLVKNVPVVIKKCLLPILESSYANKTVAYTRQELSKTLNKTSIELQSVKFQQQVEEGKIIPSQSSPRNQRMKFYDSTNTHDRVQMLLSPDNNYFVIDPKRFVSEAKRVDMEMSQAEKRKHNNDVFHDGIDVAIISPDKVSDDSLATLGIEPDPDYQNLKDVFKHMHPLEYLGSEDKKYTIRIYEYQGKYIVFVAHKVMYNATAPETQHEKLMQDIQGHMSVYPNLPSLIRRAGHILDTVKAKKEDYLQIRRDLSSILHKIQGKTGQYKEDVLDKVEGIVDVIDDATSSKIAAPKKYHLQKITGKHKGHDAQHAQSAMTSVAKRIAALTGISSATELQQLSLSDILDEESYNLEYLYHQVASELAEPKPSYANFLVAFETYYTRQERFLKEPFLTFDKQIRQCFGDLKTLEAAKHENKVVLKAEIILPLQKKYWETILREHAYKTGVLSDEKLSNKLLDTSGDEAIKQISPELYDIVFAPINEERAKFSPSFTPTQRDQFFDSLNNLKNLQSTIDELDRMLKGSI